jgi:hypothetical protein
MNHIPQQLSVISVFSVATNSWTNIALNRENGNLQREEIRGCRDRNAGNE